MLYDTLIAPFAEHDVMRRALAATFALSFSAAPIGVFLMLRRMSLIGDALSHAILPGVAIGFLLAGMCVLAMAGGGPGRRVSDHHRRRPDRAGNDAEGGRLARRVLSDFIGARRHHRLAQGQQR